MIPRQLAARRVIKNPDAVLLRQGERVRPEPGKVIMNENKDAVFNQEKVKSGCGNTICEPVNGETKESCPQDCSGRN